VVKPSKAEDKNKEEENQMKKLLVLGMTLMLFVAMGSVAMANDLDSATLSVEAGVATYGEIRDWPEFLDLGTLSGEAGETKSAETSEFRIVRNDALLITLFLEKPLTSIDVIDYWIPGELPAQIQLGTTVSLSQEVVSWTLFGFRSEWQNDVITVSAGPNVPEQPSGSFVTNSYGEYLLGKLQGAVGYKLKVEAVLGDVDEQPAGDYEGEVVLTISAPLS
jgi:hypothetical protein